MSRGQSQPRHQSVRRVPERCKTRETIEIIDVDKEKSDVVIVAEETSHQGSRGLGTKRRNICPRGVVSIDDEDGGADDTFRCAHADATSKEFCPAASDSPVSEEPKSDELLITSRKGNPPFKSVEHMRKYHDVGPSVNRFGLGFSSDSCSESDSTGFGSSEIISSGSDSSDCEIMEDSSGNIRKQWERAASRKKMPNRHRFSSEEQASGSGSTADAGLSHGEETRSKIDIEDCTKKVYSNHSKEIPAEPCPNNSSSGKENLSFNIPAAAAEFDDCFGKRNADRTDLDQLDVDATSNIGHKEPDHASETCSLRAQSTHENLSDNLRSDCRDPEIVLCTSICHLNMQHDPNIKYDDFGSLDKDEQIPMATTFGANGLHGESSFWGKAGPCPGLSSPRNTRQWDGKQFTPDCTFQEKKKPHPGKPSFSMQTQCDSTANPETAGFQEKEKTSFDEPSLCNYHHSDSPLLNGDGETTPEEPPVCNTNGRSGTTGTSVSSDTGPADVPQEHIGLIYERERHKESDEYRHAIEEEWAARQRQLLIQAEEAQRLKRKKKAETLRLLDMERRQKQRLEEIRESQKKVEETINLKEHIRAEVRKELDKMELRYKDMASLLRGLGIHVEGGPFPMPREVNVAFKQALLRFHPDRASRSDIHQQVKAEETFKLISCLKEKLQPVM